MNKRLSVAVAFLVSTAVGGGVFAGAAAAETLQGALAKAYSSNPTLNAARASLRATDELVPQALSGYRPQVSVDASYGFSTTRTRSAGLTRTVDRNPASIGLTLTQPLFQGFRVKNSVLGAEANVLSSREALRSTEQDVLLNAVGAYMDVLRDGAILGYRTRNVEFLREQVRAARDRFNVGEGTRTDIAQAEARLSSAIADVNTARANYSASRASYRQIIGETPASLQPGHANTRLVPPSLEAAVSIGLQQHPAIIAALHAVDAAAYDVKVAEGALLPTVSLEGSVQRALEPSSQADWTNSATISGRVSVPIFQGGAEYSRIRQAKEVLGQRRIEVDVAREQVRASIVAAWGVLEAARASIQASRAGVEAAQVALNGVIEEQRVGQRTTLDVLNSQQDLLNAQIALVSAQRDEVVAAYALIAAIGRLNAETLQLAAATYRPQEHYQIVRDKWIGLRTPDGR